MPFLKKQFLLTSLSIIAIGISCTFSQSYNWAIGMGSTNGTGEGHSLKVDAFGNTYVTGDFKGSVDFDPGSGIVLLGASGTLNASDVFIAKYDTQGNYVWAIKLGGDYTEHANSIDIDPSGNIYITGTFSGPTDFDPGAGVAQLPFTPTAYWESFIAKYDSNGNYIWAKSLTGGLGTSSFSLAIDDTEAFFYITGSFDGTVDFDPGSGTANLTATAGDQNIFLAKYDSSGNYIWAKSMGGNSCCAQAANCVNADFAGNVQITGYFNGTVDFDPGAGVANLIVPPADGNSNHIFIARYDSSGNYKWANAIGAYGDNRGSSLQADVTGNVYATGWFKDTVDFDPGPGVKNLFGFNGFNIFLAKYDSAGKYIWAKGFGNANGGASASSLHLDGSSNLFVTGSFFDTIDFDPGIGMANLTAVSNQPANANTFIAKYDTACNYKWAISMPASGFNAQNTGFCIDVDATDNVFVTGWFTRTADFDPGSGTANLTASNGSASDIYVAKYSPTITGIEAIEAINAVKIFPNPGNKFCDIELMKNGDRLIIVVSDVLGRNYQMPIIFQNDKIRINTETLATGIYIIKIENAQTTEQLNVKWIKEK